MPVRKSGIFLLLMVFGAALVPVGICEEPQPEECRKAAEVLNRLLAGADGARALEQQFAEKANAQPLATFKRGYCRAVLENALSKERSTEEGVQFQYESLLETTLEYERFRLETYLSSGVSPKRYFGFFDEQGRTAEYERQLKPVGAKVATLLNEYAAEQKSDIRVSAKEIVITFLAEGGALLLTDEFETVNRAHPVRHVGLDDYRKGFRAHPGLIERLDETFGTKLHSLSISLLGRSTLLRPMTFREALISTGVMYLYEKEITNRKRLADGRPSLMSLSLDEQFVQTSLVYNSGILFSDERVRMILGFQTGEYLAEVNEQNGRRKPLLEIRQQSEARERLQNGEALPSQLTSWNAVYHVSQRYGAWVALTRFRRIFDETGGFAARSSR